MKTIQDLYFTFIAESIKDDAISKFGENSQDYVNKFWNEIRQKESDSKKKDINFWLKEGFEAFKDYVDNFKSNKSIRRSFHDLTSVDNGNGKLLKIVDDYEIWKVDSYAAAKYLGRGYKNIPTTWCISSDDDEHWTQYYKIDNFRFYFLIKRDRTDSKNKDDLMWDKVAIQISKKFNFNDYVYWDLYDNDSKPAEGSKYRPLSELPKILQDIIIKEKDLLKWYERNDYDSEEEKLSINSDDGNLEKVKEAIKNGVNLKDHGDEAYFNAIRSGHLDIVKYLVQQGVEKDTENYSDVRLAAFNGYLDIIKYLIADVEISPDKLEVPLQRAVMSDNLDIVKYLVEEKAAKLDYTFLSLTDRKSMMDYIDSVVYPKRKKKINKIFFK